MRLFYFLVSVTIFACSSPSLPDAKTITDGLAFIDHIDSQSKRDKKVKFTTYFKVLDDNSLESVSKENYNNLAVAKLVRFQDPQSRSSRIEYVTYSESGDYNSTISIYLNPQKQISAFKNSFAFFETKCLDNRAIFAKRFHIPFEGNLHKSRATFKMGNGQMIEDPSKCLLNYPPSLEFPDVIKASDINYGWLTTFLK